MIIFVGLLGFYILGLFLRSWYEREEEEKYREYLKLKFEFEKTEMIEEGEYEEYFRLTELLNRLDSGEACEKVLYSYYNDFEIDNSYDNEYDIDYSNDEFDDEAKDYFCYEIERKRHEEN